MILLAATIFLPLTLANISNYTEFFTEVKNLINTASDYPPRVNNDEFFSSDTDHLQPVDYGTYDFIIVGGGTAGGILANRLTEKEFSVLVLEAGSTDPAAAAILGLSGYLYSQYNWGYNTTVQTQSCLGSYNQQCFYPRGKVLGGSSVINAGTYVRGNARDYDIWEELGNTGWSYADVLPYFKKAEKADFTIDIDPSYHGFNGPQHTNIVEDTPGLTSAFLRAFNELGKPELDYNGASQYGVGRAQFFLDFNTRASTAQAYVRPVQNRKNLHISLKSYVIKINIQSETARSVEFLKDGKNYFGTAKKEIIVSAGSINSPQLLMLSGIGPEKELKRHGIPVIKDLPVGKNLADHVLYPALGFRTNHTYYNETLEEQLELWTKAKRPLTPGSGEQTVTFWNFAGSTTDQPDAEFLATGPPVASASFASGIGLNEKYIEIYQELNSLTDCLVLPSLLHPRSVGEVTLQSKDPRDFPLINPNYYSDFEQKDLEIMYNAIQVILQLAETKAFKNFNAQLLVVPVPDCDGKHEYMSKGWWYCALRYLSISVYHPVGTTRMGRDPKTSVVNSQLKVHGIKHLRVVDAGIIPAHISGHTNAVTVMIAEKIADAIKAEHSIGNVNSHNLWHWLRLIKETHF